MRRTLLAMLLLVVPMMLGAGAPSSPRSRQAIARQAEPLRKALSAAGLTLGSPVFLRILKDDAQLEVFVLGPDGRYQRFAEHPICRFSGTLGPKLRQGDGQAPEGFYFVPPGRMNPSSSFHLSFDLGYPNAYDRAHGRTGSALMVHGDCVSIGCYAMTDPVIEQIWTLMDAAFAAGQPFVRVHALPFRLDDADDPRLRDAANGPLWTSLRQGWLAFEADGVPPDVTVRDGQYVIERRVAETDR